MALGFFLFRAFDVLKPYPANRFEKLHGGLGIMADDFMAAVYANLLLRVVMVFAGMNAWVIAVGSELLTPSRGTPIHCSSPSG